MIADELRDALQVLAVRRPVFYNEADFQHALAWELHARLPDAEVRLEVPLLLGGRERLDLYILNGNERAAIELKYPRAPFSVDLPGEPAPYTRASQDAEDDTRYLIVADVHRVERLIAEGSADVGFVIVLTNASALWRPPTRATAALDAAFRLHEGRHLAGALAWGPGTRVKEPIQLAATYACAWRDYSELRDATGARQFRYLMLETTAIPQPG